MIEKRFYSVHRKKMHILLILLISFFSINSFAAEKFQPTELPLSDFRNTPLKQAKDIIDANVILTQDGEIIRLDGIEIPGQYAPDGASDMALAAKTMLEEHIKGKNICILLPKNPRLQTTNRMGQTLAQVLSEDGVWAQKLFLENGLALAVPSETTDDIYPLLLTAETIAREGKIGLWDTDMPNPETIQPNPYITQVVTGEIVSVSTIKNNIYLNFGANWKEDFTVMIPSNMRSTLSRAGLNPAQLQGKTIRVRGNVESYYGPLIKIRYVDQIEILN